MIKNGFISLDGNSKRQRAAKLIALKKNGSHPLTFPMHSVRDDLIVCEDIFPCVMNYCPSLSHREYCISPTLKPSKGAVVEHGAEKNTTIILSKKTL